MNLGSIFTRHARYRPDHPALIFQDQRLTWRQFNANINRAANALIGLGVAKGDKVATVLPNCPELLEVYWACAKIGAVVVPMSTMLLEGALRSLLADSDSTVLVTAEAFAPMIDNIRGDLPAIAASRMLLIDGEREGFVSYHGLSGAASDQEPPERGVGPEDPFNIMYSSGTTGLPKGIVHTHAVRLSYCTSFASAYRMTPECVTMHAGAIVFNGAFVDMMPTMFLGGTYVLRPSFDPKSYIETVIRERVTHVMLVPAQIIALLESPHLDPKAMSCLEMILSLGAPLLKEHKERLTRTLPECFYELYGLTEGVITVLDKYDYPRKPDSVGIPLPLFTISILDEQGNPLPPNQVGEIAGDGPLLIPGYYKRPDLTEQAIIDGVMRTGDLGYLDEDGYLYLVDRKKDMIISGGVNVYPRDIEEIAVQHPAVKEVAAFGVPHPKWGETPLAAVTLLEGQEVDAAELRDWINQQVGAKFQRVSEVVIKPDFPRNAAGKTLKREMRAEYMKD